MEHILQKEDLAKLHVDYIVPMVAGQMLQGLETLDDVAEYSLHDMIGELRSDSALMCIALTCQQIAAQFAHLPIATVMGLEASRIVDEYATLWMSGSLGRRDIGEYILDVPEDLEALGDLLDAVTDALPEDYHVGQTLCGILSLQADAHREAIEEEINKKRLVAISRSLPMVGNIVTFPRRAMMED